MVTSTDQQRAVTQDANRGDFMMGRIKTFTIAALLGAAGMYVALQYHVVRANEGYLMVHRAPQPRLQDVYADIREWDASTWTARPAVAQALTKGGRADLIAETAGQAAADDLHAALGPAGELSANAARRWEPVTAGRTPKGIPGTQDRDTAEGSRSPWARLFGWGKSDSEAEQRSEVSADDPHVAPILPTGQTRRPIVEILPSPDEVDLGRRAQPRTDQRRYQPRTGWEPIAPSRRAQSF